MLDVKGSGTGVVMGQMAVFQKESAKPNIEVKAERSDKRSSQPAYLYEILIFKIESPKNPEQKIIKRVIALEGDII
ncbi:hypothetical protein STEG23_013550, partial [Scotinomys teguina]